MGLCNAVAPEMLEQQDAQTGHAQDHQQLLQSSDSAMRDVITAFLNEDFEELSNLLENIENIDINEPFDGGFTLLHEAAFSKDLEVTRTLIEKFKADPKVVDNRGRTPLHFAAAMDKADICDYLLSEYAGTDWKEAKTFYGHHTALFFAARNNAVKALKALINDDCEFNEIKDENGRTPICLAAEFSCMGTVRFLLEKNASVILQDKYGQPALMPIVMHVPVLALQALDQFYEELETGEVAYHHKKLDPIKPSNVLECDFKSTLNVITENRLYSLVRHPAIASFVEVEWQHQHKNLNYGRMLLQLCCTFCLTVVAVSRKWSSPYTFNLPSDIWRIIIFVLSILFTGWEVFEELRALISSHQQNRAWKACFLKRIDEDRKTCHTDLRETKMLEMSEKTVEDTMPSYWSDNWNYFDLCALLASVLMLILHGVNIYNQINVSGKFYFWIMIITVILIWFRLLNLLRANDIFGPFVIMIGRLTLNFGRFIVVFFIIYIPFVLAFYMLLGGSQFAFVATIHPSVNSTNVLVPGFEDIVSTMFNVFRLTLGDEFYDYNAMVAVDRYSVQTLLVVWWTISSILMINVFIAYLSDTFKQVFGKLQEHVLMQKAIIILSDEEMYKLDKHRHDPYYEYKPRNLL